MKEKVWEGVVIIIGIIVVVILMVLAITILAYGLMALFNLQELGTCNSLASAETSIHNYNWTIWDGCRVQTPSGYWIDLDSVPELFELQIGGG